MERDDKVYQAYLRALANSSVTAAEPTELELAAIVQGDRDRMQAFHDNTHRYKTKRQLVSAVLEMCGEEQTPRLESWGEARALMAKVLRENHCHYQVVLNSVSAALFDITGGNAGCESLAAEVLDVIFERPVMEYAKPECVDPESPVHLLVVQWWSEFRDRSVSPGVLRDMASSHGVRWPESDNLPPGLLNEYVDLDGDLLVTAGLDVENEHGWLRLSQHEWK